MAKRPLASRDDDVIVVKVKKLSYTVYIQVLKYVFFIWKKSHWSHKIYLIILNLIYKLNSRNFSSGKRQVLAHFFWESTTPSFYEEFRDLIPSVWYLGSSAPNGYGSGKGFSRAQKVRLYLSESYRENQSQFNYNFLMYR